MILPGILCRRFIVFEHMEIGRVLGFGILVSPFIPCFFFVAESSGP